LLPSEIATPQGIFVAWGWNSPMSHGNGITVS
jgi:hypothetical protein